MKYTDKYKIGVIKQFEKELNKCEIIYNPNTKGIWFINRETKYWYLEYKIETNYLWWRYEFFNMFKRLFSMPGEVFDDVISRWVEETLNCKVISTRGDEFDDLVKVEETLNCKVLTTNYSAKYRDRWVEETLNCKVNKVDWGLSQHLN